MPWSYVGGASASMDLPTFGTATGSMSLTIPGAAQVGDFAVMHVAMPYKGGTPGGAEYYDGWSTTPGWTKVIQVPGDVWHIVWRKTLTAADLGSTCFTATITGSDDSAAGLVVYRGIEYKSSVGLTWGVAGYVTLSSGILLGGTPVILTGGYATGLSGGGDKHASIEGQTGFHERVYANGANKAKVSMGDWVVPQAGLYTFGWGLGSGATFNNALAALVTPLPATVLPPARLSGRSDGLGPLASAARLGTTSRSRQSGFHPGAPGSYY